MICWDRLDEQIIGIFTPRQVRWIRKHVGALHATAHDILSPIRGDLDPTVINQPLAAGVPEFDVIRRTLADAAVVLDTLPGTGGVVVLPDSHHAWAWIWTLAECRAQLAFRLGLARRLTETTTPYRLGIAGRPERSFSKVAEWLAGVVDDLICVADLNYPTVGA